jgi:hypothetical protein
VLRLNRLSESRSSFPETSRRFSPPVLMSALAQVGPVGHGRCGGKRTLSRRRAIPVYDYTACCSMINSEIAEPSQTFLALKLEIVL